MLGKDRDPYQFHGSFHIKRYSVTLRPGQDPVLFPVPRPVADVGPYQSNVLVGKSVRCTIDAMDRGGEYVIRLEENQDSVLFPVPRPIEFSFDSVYSGTGLNTDLSHLGRRIRCSIDEVKIGSEYVVDERKTAVVSVSEHTAFDGDHGTFHTQLQNVLDAFDASDGISEDPPAQSRIHKIAGSLFYTYAWGWYTGFIEMPFFSIQGLLSSPPVAVAGGSSAEMADISQRNTILLQRYQLIASLFADESDPSFDSKNFGFLTPQEAFDLYLHSYDDRFNGYFGRALGEFLPLIPDRYR